MKSEILNALENDRIIDISTIGRKTGRVHRLEIWFHNIDGSLYITGQPPNKRDWYSNLVTNPDFTFHLKISTQADIPANARPIRDHGTRKEVLAKILKNLEWEDQLDEWLVHSPLVEVQLKADN